MAQLSLARPVLGVIFYTVHSLWVDKTNDLINKKATIKAFLSEIL